MSLQAARLHGLAAQITGHLFLYKKKLFTKNDVENIFLSQKRTSGTIL
jgi:hypothetical protein